MSLTLAVLVHVVALLVVARERATRHIVRPPAVEGRGASATTGTIGLPMTTRRNVHAFRVRDWETGRPIERARVTDVLGGQVEFTEAGGLAVLTPRPAAQLLVHVERPGYAMHAARYGNADSSLRRHDVLLRRADVPYAVIDTIFIQRCTYCHGVFGRTRGVDLTSHDSVRASRVDGHPIVRPPNPDSSRLYRVLVDTVGPAGRPALHRRRTAAVPEFEIELIAEWIRQGARPVGVEQRNVRPVP